MTPALKFQIIRTYILNSGQGSIGNAQRMIGASTLDELNWQNEGGDTLLMVAARQGNKDVAGILLNKNVDVALKNKEGKTAAIIARGNGFSEIAASIESKKSGFGGVAVNLKPLESRDFKDPLEGYSDDSGAEGGDNNIKPLSATDGLKVVGSVENKFQELLASLTTNNTDEAITQIKDSSLEDLNFQNKYGSTLLMVAASRDMSYVVEALLNKGANAYLWNKKRQTAAMIARQKGFNKVANAIESRAANEFEEFIRIILSSDSDDAIRMINTSSLEKLDYQNKEGGTLLMMVANLGWPDLVMVLLKRGVDRNLRNPWGQTAIMIARLQGDDEMVKILERFSAASEEPERSFSLVSNDDPSNISTASDPKVCWLAREASKASQVALRGG